jgi:hypothetical protein
VEIIPTQRLCVESNINAVLSNRRIPAGKGIQIESGSFCHGFGLLSLVVRPARSRRNEVAERKRQTALNCWSFALERPPRRHSHQRVNQTCRFHFHHRAGAIPDPFQILYGPGESACAARGPRDFTSSGALNMCVSDSHLIHDFSRRRSGSNGPMIDSLVSRISNPYSSRPRL